MISLVLAMLMTLLTSAPALAYTFRTIDVPFPGATDTSVHGLSDQGAVVGNYTDATGFRHHGFLSPDGLRLRQGQIYPLLNVTPQGMNGAGMVTGWYASQPTLGFLYTAGTFWSFLGPRRSSAPGTPVTFFPYLTEPAAINDHGVVVGDYRYPNSLDAQGQFVDEPFHGFRYVSATGVFTTIDVPHTRHTALTGINNHGQIVGHTTALDGTHHAFRWQDGVVTFLQVPGLEDVDLVGITDAGVLAGSAGQVGFVYDGATVQIVEVPGATLTDLAGIRQDGTVYGRFLDSQGENHGFIATPSNRRMPQVSVKAQAGLFQQSDCDPGSKRRVCRGR